VKEELPNLPNGMSLRPKSLADFAGQEETLRTLRLAIQAARERQEAVDHVILYGPPGLGKTTLAHIIAGEMGASLRATSGPVLTRSGDIASILTNLEQGDVLFIDEIHRLHKSVEEMLYSAMEEYCLDIVIGKGPAARTVRLDLNKFTVVGATTRIGLLSSPLRSRFGVSLKLDFYSPEKLKHIVKRSASLLEINLEEEAALVIAERSRGTPRVANNILRRVRDYAQVNGKTEVDKSLVKEALKVLGVDEAGLCETDRQFLTTIVGKFSGGPVGVTTLSAALSEDQGTIEDVIEPYLIQLGFIQRTPRGRLATPKAYRHLDLPVPGGLF